MRLLREDAGFLLVSVSIASRYPRSLPLVSRSLANQNPNFPVAITSLSLLYDGDNNSRALLHLTQRPLWNDPNLHPSVPLNCDHGEPTQPAVIPHLSIAEITQASVLAIGQAVLAPQPPVQTIAHPMAVLLPIDTVSEGGRCELKVVMSVE